MTWYPHVTAACVVERDGAFLMVNETIHGRSVYNQPAGHLDEGETLVEAAIRECKEETGWEVEPTAFLRSVLFKEPLTQITYLRHTFIAKPLKQLKNSMLDECIIQALWMNYEQITAVKKEHRNPMVMGDIQCFLTGQAFPLDLLHHYPLQ